MAIFLLILKIIGIVLLSILGLALVLVLLVLFVPIRYKLDANYYDTYHVSAKVSYLLHIVSFQYFLAKDDKKCILKVFGITIKDFNKKDEESETKTNKKKTKKKSDKDKADNKTAELETVSNNQIETLENKLTSLDDKNFDLNEEFDSIGLTDEKSADDSIESDEVHEELSFFEKMKVKYVSIKEKVKTVLKDVKEKIISLKSKTLDFKENTIDDKKYTIKAWLNVLDREQTKRALSKGKDLTIKLLKHILPTKWNGFLHVGFDNPSNTAIISEYYWMFIGIFTNHIVFVPDFEHTAQEGYLKAKGRIRLIHIVIAGIKFMYVKDYIYLRKIREVVDREKEKLIRRDQREKERQSKKSA